MCPTPCFTISSSAFPLKIWVFKTYFLICEGEISQSRDLKQSHHWHPLVTPQFIIKSTGYCLESTSTVNHTVLWRLNWGPVGGVLSASCAILASTSLPPSFPMEISPSIPFPHFFSSSPHSVSSASSSHTSLCPREQCPAHTHRHTPANTRRTCTAAPRKRDKELATPKGPASVTLLPRRDHMATGAERSERTERRSGDKSRRGRKRPQVQKKEEMW